MPLALLDDDAPLDLEAAREWFVCRVLGQPDAVARVLDLLALTKTRLARPGKPLASLLLPGPTGTGKTEMAKALAAFLFGDEARLSRFDLNDFPDALAVQRLMGGASGAEGLLTARVREQPFSVLLLDEFEKADPSFFDLWLQILGDARLTDAAGRVADFSNAVIVMTSNLGAQGFQRGPSGFQTGAAKADDARAHFTTAVRDFLRPEIFNRLDAIVPFDPLSFETMLAIARRQLELVTRRDGLALRPIAVELGPGVAEHLARAGYDPRYGARPLKRAVDRELTVPLAEALSGRAPDAPLRVEVTVAGGALAIKVVGVAPTRPDAATDAAGPDSELAGAIVRQRRRLVKFGRGDAVREIETQVTLLSALERRLQRAARKGAPPVPQLAALPRLRACLTGVGTLMDRATALEVSALPQFHQRQPLPRAALTRELSDLTRELPRRRREVFWLLHPAADEVLLVFFSEHRETLLACASAFAELIQAEGKLLGLEAFLPPKGGRRGAVVLAREPAGRPAEFFKSPPAQLLGLALRARGELFEPRFSGEAGLHEYVNGDARHVCLLLAAEPPLDKYSPPIGIERPGGIDALGESLRRRYDLKRRKVEDPRLDTASWRVEEWSETIGRLSAQALSKHIEAATD